MKKIILLLSISLALFKTSLSQITGDSIVCAGYIYNYSVSIPNAVTYIWTTPTGWYGLTGQGTSSIDVTANASTGNICVEGFDANAISVGVECITTQWGGGGAVGWDVVPPVVEYCIGEPGYAYLTLQPNGTGGGNCPPGCGNGTQHPNLAYGLYDNNYHFLGVVDGSLILLNPWAATYHVYYVDTTLGVDSPNVVIINGGCGSAVINNVVTSIQIPYVPIVTSQFPDPACLGDTVIVYASFTFPTWTVVSGLRILSYPDFDEAEVILDSIPAAIYISGQDPSGCPHEVTYFVNIVPCTFQISGDSIVCSGYTYNYSASIPGAVTYNWTLPTGWYGLTGQGTSSISATCNVNTGNICVEGFDANSISVGTQCINTQWGNGGAAGWDIWPSSFYYCSGQDRPVHFMIIPDTTGSGSCPGGCGSGTQIPNLIYGLYDSSIPYPQFVAEVDGSWITMPPVTTTYHVHYVDTSAGSDFPDAVIISGGCGAAAINNTVTSNEVTPWPPQFIQSPDPACIGDTVLITQTETTISNVSWSVFGGNILSYPNPEQILIVVTSSNPQISYDGFDQNYFCNTSGGYPLNMCSNPSAAFNALSNPICPGSCTDFNNLSFSATSYEWIFPGANPSSSTDVNPANICYNIPGSYDVTLIASNSQGTDTLVVTNYITVYPLPPSQNIILISDTLVANTGFVSYQWYYNAVIIAGATEFFYVPNQDGDYTVISVDSNGCMTDATYLGFVVQPAAGFTVIENPICPGTCTDLNNISTNAISYEWLFPGGNPSTSTQFNPSNICYNIPGSYDVTLIAFNSSGSDTMLIPNYIIVYPYSPPQTINQYGDTLVANQNFVTYQWYFSSIIIPGATEYFYVGTQDGDYNLICVDSNGCEVESVYQGFVTGIISAEAGSVSISPNPAREIMEVKITGNILVGESRIFNILGKEIDVYVIRKDDKKIIFNVSMLLPGIYFFEFRSGENISRMRFIKE